MGGSSSRQHKEKIKQEAAEQQRRLTFCLLQLQEQERLRAEAERRLQVERLQAVERERQRRQREQRFQAFKREKQLLQHEERVKTLFLSQLVQKEVKPNLALLNSLQKASAPRSRLLEQLPQKVYEETDLEEENRLIYFQVRLHFKQTNKNFFKTTKITRVTSPFHQLQYQLMKAKYKEVYQEKVEECSMFHGTKQEFLDGICTYNFDRNKVQTAKFGKGISFARDSYYATHYHHDNKKRVDKVMVMANVLVGMTESGKEHLQVPDECYTAVNKEESVIVKFDDASFYPAFIIYYEGIHPPGNNNRAWRKPHVCY